MYLQDQKKKNNCRLSFSQDPCYSNDLASILVTNLRAYHKYRHLKKTFLSLGNLET